MNNTSGILYIVATPNIVATPIGNLQGMGLRAIEILKSVNWIAAEDTRHSQYLLQHFSIKAPLISLHEHNETGRTHLLISRLWEGQSIALISDARTPLISDPGQGLVEEAMNQGVPIVPVPGPCAAIAALEITATITGKKKKEFYQLGLYLKNTL